ncbi:integrase [Lactobacillus phage T25]|uniref:Integrase n=2 Tax=root TaxID=1 RepID=A0A2Z6BEL3_9CAUD|nr:integrase [Lactobacillus phage T25]BBD20166.1 integrase family protein [Lactobacillus phage T25]
MKYYFADRKSNILGVGSTDGKGEWRIDNDIETQSVDNRPAVELSLDIHFTTDQEQAVNEMAKATNFIMYQDEEGNAHQMVIESVDHDSLGHIHSIVASDAGNDLINETVGAFKADKYNLKKYIIPKIGDIRLAKYTLKEHQEFISSLFNDGLSLNTVKLINGTLHNALKKAVAIGYITKNPTVGVEFSAYAKDNSKKLHFWTKDQVGSFIEAAEEDKEPMWLSFFVTLIDCGLRVGEAMALRWSDIDFSKNTLSVNATRIYRAETGSNAGKIALDRPKTLSSKRTEYMTARVNDLLQQQYERHFSHGNVQGFRFSTSHNNDFVFTYSSDAKFGQPLRSRATTGAFNRITNRAGLPHIRIHDLRHTHAVLMREAGLSLDDIKDDLGHKDISTTQIYAEISPAKKKENHQQFEKYLNQ